MGPTQTKVYLGTPDEQQAALLADSEEAVQHGWQPQSFEQVAGSMRVTYEYRAPAVATPPTVGTDGLEPAAELEKVRRLRRRDVWEPIAHGWLLAVPILVIWWVFVYRPAPEGIGVQPTPVQPAFIHCSPASAALMVAIEGGLTVPGGGGLRDGYTVKSRDHAEVYFVAARITDENMDQTVGLWATSDLVGGGALYSVDGTARKFSSWPDGSAAEVRLSPLDDGADVAVACADG